MESFRAVVSGIVQGVGYRYFAAGSARELGLSGHARNLPTGQVEVAAAGDKETLEEFLRELRRGPSHSNVTGVEVEWNVAGESITGDFKIKY